MIKKPYIYVFCVHVWILFTHICLYNYICINIYKNNLKSPFTFKTHYFKSLLYSGFCTFLPSEAHAQRKSTAKAEGNDEKNK